MAIALAVLLVLCAFVECSLSQSLQWKSITPSTTLPPARKHSSMIWTATALYVFGGEGDSGPLGDMWMYSLLTMEWSLVYVASDNTEGPASRYGHVGGVMGDYWFICHGTNGDTVFSDTWAFHLVSKTWSKVNITGEEGEVPQGRYFASGGTAIGDSEKLWMSMGINRVGRKMSDTWILMVNMTIPHEGTWLKVSDGAGLNQYDPTMPHARSNTAGAPLGNGVFVISGGCASGGQVGGPCPLHDVWALNEYDGSWSRLSSCPPPSHTSSLSPLNIQLPEILVLYGGTQKGPRGTSQVLRGPSPQADELYLINATTLKWSRVKLSDDAVTPPIRSSAHMAPGAGGLFMFGGESDDGSLLNDLWLLEGTGINATILPCSNEWFSTLHLHGILMYIAWGLLLPLGALMGRYYRWSRSVWLIIHIICQVLGTILTVAGFVLVLLVSAPPTFPHGVIGIILMVVITQQLITGMIRPWSRKRDEVNEKALTGKKAIIYKWHRCWKVYHRVSGVIAIAMGYIQVTLGVFLVDAPVVVWGVWLALLSLWLMAFLIHEVLYGIYCMRSQKQQEKH